MGNLRRSDGLHTYRAKYRQCGKVKKDSELIYDVASDSYFCNQQQMDNFNGITRDKMGFVINK